MADRSATQRLYRSRDACFGGVCGGIACRYDLDTIVVRLMAIGLTVMTLGLAGFVYLILWVVIPREPERKAPCEVMPEQVESSAYGCLDLANASTANAQADGAGGSDSSVFVRVAVAACLAALFLVVAMNVSPLVSGSEWWQFWPVGMGIVGLCLVVVPVTERFAAQFHAAGIIIAAFAISFVPMSLGIISWHTLELAFTRMWVLLALALALLCVGTYRGNAAVVIGGSLVVVVFCLYMLMSCTVPGDVTDLMIRMPDGRSLRVAISQVFLAM